MIPWRVLISAPYFQRVLHEYASRLSDHGIATVVPVVHERLSEADLLALVGDIDGAICGDDCFTANVFARAPRLRVVVKWGTGVDSIDRVAAARAGVVIQNTPDAFTDPVADTTVGYILQFSRGLVALDRAMRDGRWEKGVGRSLAECTVGIIGFGTIGRAVAQRLRPFGCRVLAYDTRTIAQEDAAASGCTLVDRDALLRSSDFVTLHCDLNPTSRGCIDAEALAMMRPTAVLINTARGPLIDERALVVALEHGTVAGAALDVFTEEPLPQDHPFRRMTNVLLAPHNANASPAAWRRVHEESIAHLLRELTVHASVGVRGG